MYNQVSTAPVIQSLTFEKLHVFTFCLESDKWIDRLKLRFSVCFKHRAGARRDYLTLEISVKTGSGGEQLEKSSCAHGSKICPPKPAKKHISSHFCMTTLYTY